MDEIFIDSGVFIHLFDYLDRSNTLFTHDLIKNTYHELLDEGNRFLTTNFVISEVLNRVTNIVNKADTPYNFDWVFKFSETYIHKNLTIHLLDNSIIDPALKICKEYSYLYSFVDASCFAFLKKYGFGEGSAVVKLFTIDFNWTLYNYLQGHEFKPVSYVNIF